MSDTDTMEMIETRTTDLAGTRARLRELRVREKTLASRYYDGEGGDVSAEWAQVQRDIQTVAGVVGELERDRLAKRRARVCENAAESAELDTIREDLAHQLDDARRSAIEGSGDVLLIICAYRSLQSFDADRFACTHLDEHKPAEFDRNAGVPVGLLTFVPRGAMAPNRRHQIDRSAWAGPLTVLKAKLADAEES